MSTCQTTTRWQYGTEHRGEEGLQIVKVPIVSMNVTGNFFPSQQKKYLVISE